MSNSFHPNRRLVLAGAAAGLAVLPARAQQAINGPIIDGDQTEFVQNAFINGFETGRVALPAGRFRVSNLDFPGGLVIEGIPGMTCLVADGDTIGTVSAQTNLVLRDIGFTGNSGDSPLLTIDGSGPVTLERCHFLDAPGIALQISNSGAIVRDCTFSSLGDAAIHALDNQQLLVNGNVISNCGNAGIRIWRSEPGLDGSIITNNRISTIDWRGGGNGQNGNGVNVFRAHGVIVASNFITDCAFTAVRLNTTNNTQVTGNTCLRSGEVAIFSEFAFSGSVIANNIVDGAATGISMTNLDSGGHIAVCSGNIVRNISPRSEVNPDTVPIGIAAEAEASITGNTIHNVPGLALLAGYGPYLRNVTIASNTVADCDIGIGISVVEGAGTACLAGNLISARQHDVVGLAWAEIVEPDLLANIDRCPNVTAS
jgi:uncharacterized secreted repeat protein (TIGR03808 family)